MLSLNELAISEVQPAFFVFWTLPPPSSGSLVFPRLDCPRAAGATNTYETLVVQGVVRDIVLFHEIPDVLLCPIPKGIEF